MTRPHEASSHPALTGPCWILRWTTTYLSSTVISMAPILSPPTLPAGLPRDFTNIPSIFSAGEYDTLAATWHLMLTVLLSSLFSLSVTTSTVDHLDVSSSGIWQLLRDVDVLMSLTETKIYSNCKSLQSCSFRFLAEISSACSYRYYKYYFFSYRYILLLIFSFFQK